MTASHGMQAVESDNCGCACCMCKVGEIHCLGIYCEWKVNGK